MKTRLLSLTFAALVIAALLFSVNLTALASTPTTVPDPPLPPTPPANSTFAQRLAMRKKEQQVKLSTTDLAQIKSMCSGAQSKLQAIINSTQTVVNNHENVYQNVDGMVWETIGQLKLSNQNTSALELQLNDYDQNIATFQSMANNYIQSLNDVTNINCAADPVGFEALLDTAREYYAAVTEQSQDVSQVVSGYLSPSIENFSNQLQNSKSSSSNSGS